MFVFTSCTNNYIPKARVLASTLKSFHPDWTFCLLLGENPPEGFVLEQEPFDRLAGFDQLGIPEYRSWLFRHRVVEICTAAKGPALHHFLTREKHRQVMYLDPDIMVCNSLSPLETLLRTHDVLLTPHQLAPQETQQSIVDNELCAMKYGVFNLGFVAASGQGDGPRFARWWRDRLLQYCYDDIPNGIFTDQRWCDLAPAFFPNLHIVRDPGCNAASWNLTDRTIARDADGSFLANDAPLRFYHFTGFDSGAGDVMTARYAKAMPAVHELWALYRERLMANGHAALGKAPWACAVFDDGTPIADAMRLLYRERADVRFAFPDPFCRPGFLDWYIADQAESAKAPVRRFLRKAGVVASRTKAVLDQHGGFPRGLPGTARQTLAWLRKWGAIGMARKIWRSAPENTPPGERLPLLTEVLRYPDSPLFRLLDPSHASVCVLENDWGGGAGVYCEERVAALLAQGKSVIRLCYAIRFGRLELTACYGEERFRCAVAEVTDLADSRFPPVHDLIVNELAGWHLLNYDFARAAEGVMETLRDLARVARRHQARLELLFHDYYPVCPSIYLLTPENSFCGLSKPHETCDLCALRGKPFSMAKWREAWGEFVALADETVFFSQDTLDRVASVYPLREGQARLRPHVVKSLGIQLRIPVDGPMRIAVVGHIQTHKGADMLLQLASLLDRRLPDASILLFGKLEARDVPRNIVALGSYKRDELGTLLQRHRVTVGLLPSICPETFSLVAHELASAALPLAAFPLGAQGAFVAALPNGRVAHETSAESILEALLELDAARRNEAYG